MFRDRRGDETILLGDGDAGPLGPRGAGSEQGAQQRQNSPE
jgi:hypothetical protein